VTEPEAAAAGQAARGAEALYEALPLPESVRDLVRLRLSALAEAPRRLAEAAAVLGRELDARTLAALAGLEAGPALEGTSDLLARQVLEDAGAGRLRFTHDKLREVAYVEIDASRRCVLHRAAAEALDAPDGREARLAVLGHHWEQAGVAGRARECYLAGARYAVSRYAHADAETLFRAYLALVAEPTAESIHVLYELGEDLHLQGRPDDAIREYQRAIDEARGLADQRAEARSLHSLSILQTNTARLAEARASCEQALALWRRIGDRRGEASILGNQALIEQLQGRLDEACALYEQALAVYRDGGPRGNEGYLVMNLAVLRLSQGRLEEARALYERTVDIGRETADRRLEGSALHNLGDVHESQGKLGEALSLFQQALEIHREIGNRRFEGVTLGALGEIHHARGQFEQAAAFYEQALAIHREVGHRRFEVRALIHLGRLSCDRGQPPTARALLDEAVDLSRRHAYPEEETMALRGMAFLERRAEDDPARAGALLLQAESIAQERGYSLQLAACRCELGHLELAQGRPARSCLLQAQALASGAQVGAESQLGSAIARLQRAVEAFEAGLGHRLLRGECVEDVPEALR
jgi:tetratricopeptide (TPR) repeat protein